MDRLRLVEPFLDELDSNDRLRYGIYFILILGLVWFMLVLGDVRIEMSREHGVLQDRYSELQNIGDLELWQQRFREQASTQKELSALLWRSASKNQTLAAVQSAIRKLAADGGITKSNIRIGTPQVADESLGVYSVRTRIRGQFEADQVLSFVASIEDFYPALIFENLTIEIVQGRSTDKNRINADIVAYYQEPGT